MQEIVNKIRKLTLAVVLGFEVDLVVDEFDQVLLHLGQPLLVINGLKTRLGDHFLVVEVPVDQRSRIFDCLAIHIVAFARFLKDLPAHGDWSLNDGVHNLVLVLGVEDQVHHVEVKTPVDIADDRDPFDKDMGGSVPMALDYTVDGVLGEGVDELGEFVGLLALGLVGVGIPDPVIQVRAAGIADMADNHYSMSTILFQFLGLVDHDVLVLQELVQGK
jgi:hypothetical protein